MTAFGAQWPPSEPEPHGPSDLDQPIDWLTYSHPQLYEMVHNNLDLGGASENAGLWMKLSKELDGLADDLRGAMRTAKAGWSGDASDRADGAVNRLADWLADAAQRAGKAADCVTKQAEAAETALRTMPEPPDGTAVAAAAGAPAGVLHGRAQIGPCTGAADAFGKVAQEGIDAFGQLVDGGFQAFGQLAGPFAGSIDMFGQAVAEGYDAFGQMAASGSEAVGQMMDTGLTGFASMIGDPALGEQSTDALHQLAADVLATLQDTTSAVYHAVPLLKDVGNVVNDVVGGTQTASADVGGALSGQPMPAGGAGEPPLSGNGALGSSPPRSLNGAALEAQPPVQPAGAPIAAAAAEDPQGMRGGAVGMPMSGAGMATMGQSRDRKSAHYMDDEHNFWTDGVTASPPIIGI